MKIELRLSLRVTRRRESACEHDDDTRQVADLSGTSSGDYERADGPVYGEDQPVVLGSRLIPGPGRLGF